MAGVERAVRIHIERGDDLNARDSSGMTPLMLSAARNRPVICKLLLEAGADHSLLDPSGKTAFEIAVAARAEATAAILKTAHGSIPALPSSALASCLGLGVASGSAPELMESPLPVINQADDGDFDLSGWQVEEEPARPATDHSIVDSAGAVQIAITAHTPVDSSAQWDDIDTSLPEAALPLARTGDAEDRARLRLLLLRALREGSVPAIDIQVHSTNEDRSSNLEAEASLIRVINDLGAEIDERFDCFDAIESFEVFVDPDETPEEEAIIDEALAAFDGAASSRYAPLRIYQQEFQRLRLLTSEEETQLAKAMEAALDVALDALASWPEGIARVLGAGAEAIAGSRQLSAVCVGNEPEPIPAEELDLGGPTRGQPEEGSSECGDPADEASANASNTEFADAFRQLAVLIESEKAPKPSREEIRLSVARLRLNRRFLLELIDTARGSAPCPEFACAMSNFRRHRDRMAAANLKLAFFHAKKYQYSGEPLDDLAQEANIGLLKAVDRYDWRRGFRFSTYATWWIRQQIGRHVADKGRTIRVPAYISEKLQRAQRMAEAFETANGRAPTLVELAERMDLPSHKFAALLRVAPEPSGIDELTVDCMIAIEVRDTLLPPDPADIVEANQLRAVVEGMLKSMPKRDEEIIRLRFGIGVDEVLSLEEVGRRYAVTRERIRQIEAKALRKLRQASSARPLTRNIQPPTDRRAFAPEDVIDKPDDDTAEQLAVVMENDNDSLSASNGPLGSSKGNKLERILKEANELGIRVDDERTVNGHLWVALLETPEKAHRRLARMLLELGFAFWPGKGYWK
jgi:RNA polymerase primary sigma factor